MCSKLWNKQESYLIQLLLLVHHVKRKNSNGLVVCAGGVKKWIHYFQDCIQTS